MCITLCHKYDGSCNIHIHSLESDYINVKGWMGKWLSLRIPNHFLHSLCKCMGCSLKVPIENMQWWGYSKDTLGNSV